MKTSNIIEYPKYVNRQKQPRLLHTNSTSQIIYNTNLSLSPSQQKIVQQQDQILNKMNKYSNNKSINLSSSIKLPNQISVAGAIKKQQSSSQIKPGANFIRKLDLTTYSTTKQQSNLTPIIKPSDQPTKKQYLFTKLTSNVNQTQTNQTQNNQTFPILLGNNQNQKNKKQQTTLNLNRTTQPQKFTSLGNSVYTTPPQLSKNYHQLPTTVLNTQKTTSQWKYKYDELKINYDKKCTQLDELKKQRQKLQIKLLNYNQQYYQKQIKRLIQQIQKCQQLNQDYKFKYLQNQNIKKQLQISIKTKQKYLQNILKQFEKQKIYNIQLKHQIQQKQKIFQHFHSQFDKSYQQNNYHYNQTLAKANKLQVQLKTKINQYDQLLKTYTTLQKKFTDEKDANNKYKQLTEQKLKTYSKNLQQKINQLSKQKIQHDQKILSYKQQIQKYKSQKINIQFIKNKKNQQLTIIKSNRLLQLDIVKLQDIIRQLNYQIKKKNQIICQFQSTISKIKNQQDIKKLQNIITQLKNSKNFILQQHQKIYNQLRKQIDLLKIQQISQSKPLLTSNNINNFQQILKIQLQENGKLKKQISVKIDQVYNLKSTIDDLKVQKQNMTCQMQILKKIKKNEQKNIKIDAQIANQYIKSDIDAYKRKIQLLQLKLTGKIKQVKQKDNFIMANLLGRSKPQDVPFILADFQRIFQSDYREKLNQANKRIEDLLGQRRF